MKNSRRRFLQVLNFLLSTGVVVVCLVEFGLPPPVYDSFPNEFRFESLPSPDDVFAQISPWGASNASIHRVMDAPILTTILMYYVGCFYFRFRREAWMLTGAACIVVLTFSIVHRFSDGFFDWKYLGPRLIGISLEIAAMSLLGTCTITLIQARRERFKFYLQRNRGSDRVPKSRISLVFNLVCNCFQYFICLVMWSAGSYQSFVFVRSPDDMEYLCQVVSGVLCKPCPTYTPKALAECVHNSTTFCHSPDMGRGFCIFNYNTGYFTFIRMFAYSGGLFFFLRNFINAMLHYIFLSYKTGRQLWDQGRQRLDLLRVDSCRSAASEPSSEELVMLPSGTSDTYSSCDEMGQVVSPNSPRMTISSTSQTPHNNNST